MLANYGEISMKISLGIIVSVVIFISPIFSQDAGIKNQKAKQGELDNRALSGSKTVDDLKLPIKKFKNKRGYKVEYDRFDDSTLVYYDGFDLMSFGESFGKLLATANTAQEPPSLYMKLYFGFSTNSLGKNIQKFLLVFTSTDTEWHFLKNRELYAIADGERFRFGEGDLGDADIDVSRRGIAVREAAEFILSREQLRKLADSEKVEIRTGKREQVLKNEHKIMFRDMLTLGTTSETVIVKDK